MSICHAIITPVTVFLRMFVRVIREIVRTVCDWVSTVIRTVRTVVERVCRWLPWPLSALCNLVTRVIEVFERVWRWVCRNVLERIVSWIEKIVEYVIYILRWVCWLVSWPTRVIAILLCRAGIRPVQYVHLCVKVLTDAAGVPAAEWDEVNRDLREASTLFRKCGIQLVVIDRARIEKTEFLTGTTCDFTGLFTEFFTWLSQNECVGCSSVTAYYVRDIQDVAGCSYPGSNWFTVDRQGGGATLVHEIGHLSDLTHTDDRDNIMYGQGAGSQITSSQCCLYRTSRFAVSTPCAPPFDGEPDRDDVAEGTESLRPSVGGSQAFEAFNRKGPDSLPVMPSRVVQAGLALVAVMAAGRALGRLLLRRR
jgi:hypothetical protein